MKITLSSTFKITSIFLTDFCADCYIFKPPVLCTCILFNNISNVHFRKLFSEKLKKNKTKTIAG